MILSNDLSNFEKFDSNHINEYNFYEFLKYFTLYYSYFSTKSIDCKPKELRMIVSFFDKDLDGKLNYDEYVFNTY